MQYLIPVVHLFGNSVTASFTLYKGGRNRGTTTDVYLKTLSLINPGKALVDGRPKSLTFMTLHHIKYRGIIFGLNMNTLILTPVLKKKIAPDGSTELTLHFCDLIL